MHRLVNAVVVLLPLTIFVSSFSPKRGYVADDCSGPLCNGNILLDAAWFYAYNPGSPYNVTGSFVPMHWCTTGDDAPLPAGTNDTFLLGFNEPNNAHNCNISPETAAQAWSVILKRWGNSSTHLVSPATAGDGIPWLDDFFSNCTHLYGPAGCQITHVAVHDYSCTPSTTMAYLESIHARYGMPVWMTEFSCGDGAQNKPMSDHLAYMKAIFPLLDAAPYVYRYAWMSGKSANRGLLQGAPGAQTLTPVGELFKSL